jgi:hypothetical protein
MSEYDQFSFSAKMLDDAPTELMDFAREFAHNPIVTSVIVSGREITVSGTCEPSVQSSWLVDDDA